MCVENYSHGHAIWESEEDIISKEAIAEFERKMELTGEAEILEKLADKVQKAMRIREEKSTPKYRKTEPGLS